MRARFVYAVLIVAGLTGISGSLAETNPEPPKPAAPAEVQPALKPAAPAAGQGLPEVFYDPSLLPEPVQRMRERILEAARTGDIERLRPVLESNETPPVFSLGETQGDAIQFWKEQSGDGEGREILAILTEILEAGYLHVDKGTPQEMYLWPYFAQYPLDKLTPPQMVEMFKILTGQDYAEMKEDGTYVFFRAGIGPDGTWHFFVAGD
jgi:hypothetical protein